MPNITPADLRDHFVVPPGDERDAQLQAIASGVNARIVSATGRDWTRQVRREAYRGTGIDSICLRHYPVPRLLSLEVDGIAWDVSTDQKVALNPEEGIIYRVDDDVWPLSRRQNVKVGYEGGPTGPPHDLRLAALEMAMFVYQASGGRTLVDASGSVRVRLLDKAMEDLPTVQKAIQDHSDWMRGFYRGG